MEDAATILIIILASVLSIFLVVAIVLAVKLIALIKILNNVALKAGEVVDNVETAAATLRKAAGPFAVGKFLMNIANVVSNRKRGR